LISLDLSLASSAAALDAAQEQLAGIFDRAVERTVNGGEA
jgi:hypothetical protein